MLSRTALAGLLAWMGVGCTLYSDPDSVILQRPATRDAAHDVGDLGALDDFATADVGPGPDSTAPPTDVRLEDVAPDVGPDLSKGGTCTDMPGTLAGEECDIVAQDCSGEQVCKLFLNPSGPTPEFFTRCTTESGASYELDEGDPCDPQSPATKCRRGLDCLNDACARYCRLADGTGCATDQVCALIGPELAEYGTCAATCE